MKELKEIIRAYDECQVMGKSMALGAIVHVDGSSYRRPGARMLVDEEGKLTGAISGGCLEGDALRKALLAISSQQSRLVTYDTSEEDDKDIGVQLGCAGIIQVLFEPLDIKAENNPVSLLKKATAKRQNCVLVTLFNLKEKNKPQPGTCLLLEEDGTITGDIQVPVLKNQVLQNARQVLSDKNSCFINYKLEDSTVIAFLEFIPPPVSLIVIGAGNDVIPLVNMADALGWDVTVADGRNNLARSGRFVAACQVLVSKPEKVLDQVIIDSHTVFVLMTHNYNYDLAMLKSLITRDIVYIGLLGPRKKLQQMLEDLGAEGIKTDQSQLDKIYAPVGLEIGAETAAEIAISIIAEIKAVLAGYEGGMLRNKKDVIHSRSATRISDKQVNYE